MKKLQLYVGGTNNITYRYDIKKVDDAFSVRIFSIVNKSHIETGTKLLRFINAHEVMDECISHYIRQAKSVKGFLRSLWM